MIGLDTNVLVRYLVEDDEAQSRKAARLINEAVARDEELFISDTTVKTHITHILQKLGLRDRVQAVVLAHETGLFDADVRHT